jgi:VWFA-related protein
MEAHMSHTRFRAALVVGALAACGAAQGQSPKESPPAVQGPTFRAGTTVVEVDVIVRDKQSRFVDDLRMEDFEVLEDGVPQQVSAIYRVVGPADQTSAVASGSQPSPVPPPPPQLVQRVIVLFFDQAHIQPGGFDRARKAALGFLQHQFRQGDVGGVVNGGTMVNNHLTSVRQELEAAVSSIKPAPAPEGAYISKALHDWPRFIDIDEALRVTKHAPGISPGPLTLDDVVARACRDRPDSCQDAEQEAENKATQLVDEARRLGKQTLNTAAGLANGLARLPGRKTVILMSDGFFTEDDWSELRAVVGRAARASVRFYSLDTRGLNRGSASGDIITSAYPSQPEMSAPSVGDTNADGPNSLAVDTGGFVIRNENDFGKALADIDRDTSSYYILGFRTNKPLDGKFRTLAVRVKRSGLSVRARKGYIADPGLAAGGLVPTPGTSQPAGASPAVPTPAASTPGAAAAPAVAPSTTAAATLAPAGTPVAGAYRARPHLSDDVATLERAPAGPSQPGVLPDNLKKKANAGWEAYQHGDVAAAKAALLPVAEHPEAPPWTRYVLGWSHYALGEAAAAAASWERVRQAVPQFRAVYFDLADAYQRQGEYSKAIAVLRDAGSRWPKDVEVYSALGVVQLARGTVDDAIVTFEQAVAVDPNDATAAYNLGKTYEVRFVRAERLGKVGPGSVNQTAAQSDRDRAIASYRRVVAIGGPLVSAAKDGLKRLGDQG